MTYKEYRSNRQAEFNSIPKFYAFNKKQFDEELSKRNATCEEVVCINHSFYMLKKDRPLLDAYIRNARLSELMKNKEFAIGAFLYEMQNCEYQFNCYQGNFDVLSNFTEGHKLTYDQNDDYDEYLKQMGHPEWHSWYEEARSKFRQIAIKNNWY